MVASNCSSASLRTTGTLAFSSAISPSPAGGGLRFSHRQDNPRGNRLPPDDACPGACAARTIPHPSSVHSPIAPVLIAAALAASVLLAPAAQDTSLAALQRRVAAIAAES